MENLLFLGVPILKHIRVLSTSNFVLDFLLVFPSEGIKTMDGMRVQTLGSLPEAGIVKPVGDLQTQYLFNTSGPRLFKALLA